MTWDVDCSVTGSARTEPMRRPQTFTSSAITPPSRSRREQAQCNGRRLEFDRRDEALPLDVTLPVIVRSSLIVETVSGAESSVRSDELSILSQLRFNSGVKVEALRSRWSALPTFAKPCGSTVISFDLLTSHSHRALLRPSRERQDVRAAPWGRLRGPCGRHQCVQLRARSTWWPRPKIQRDWPPPESGRSPRGGHRLQINRNFLSIAAW